VGEFELIQRWLSHFDPGSAGLVVGPGDDAAVVSPPEGDLVLTTDALVDGVHFLSPRWPPEDIGHKAVAVNLSDLAAMGAEPLWLLLALGLPSPPPGADWLDALARGAAALARTHGVSLIGGNVSRSPALSLTLTAVGRAPRGQHLRRSGAQAGDRVYVSGALGDAALGLQLLLAPGQAQAAATRPLIAQQRRPTPRVALGQGLLGIASACLDISDGLAQDLGHLLTASGVGAEIFLGALPLSEAYRAHQGDRPEAWAPAVCGGEDYELLFTAPPAQAPALAALSKALSLSISQIGVIEEAPGLRWRTPAGERWEPPRGGWQHL